MPLLCAPYSRNDFAVEMPERYRRIADDSATESVAKANFAFLRISLFLRLVSLQKATVDNKFFAGHVGGRLGGEIQDARGDLLRCTLALEGHGLLHHLFLVGAPSHELDRWLVERRVDPSRAHAVHSNVIWSEF